MDTRASRAGLALLDFVSQETEIGISTPDRYPHMKLDKDNDDVIVVVPFTNGKVTWTFKPHMDDGLTIEYQINDQLDGKGRYLDPIPDGWDKTTDAADPNDDVQSALDLWWSEG